MKAKDLREKSLEDLKELEKSTMKEVFQTKFKNFTNRLDDTSMIRKTRRELARIRTLLVERARGAMPAATSDAAHHAPKAKPAKVAAAPKAHAQSAKSADKKPGETKKKPAAQKTTEKKSEAK